MNAVTKSMAGVVRGMDKGLASMDVDKLSATMDKFERQFEDMDVKAAYSEFLHLDSSSRVVVESVILNLVIRILKRCIIP